MPIPYFACQPFVAIMVNVTGNVSGYSVSWTRVDASGGANFSYGLLSGTTYQFSNGMR